jgi:hypothetical protein
LQFEVNLDNKVNETPQINGKQQSLEVYTCHPNYSGKHKNIGELRSKIEVQKQDPISKIAKQQKGPEKRGRVSA